LAEAELRRESTKLRALEVAELLGLDAADTEEAKKLAEEKRKKNEDGFLESLKMKIINNLQIFVDGIHIRYEDDQANPEQPFAFGITLEHFHAQSTDGNWNPTFLKLKEEIQHKLVTLKNLAVYWDTPADKAVHVSQMGGTVEQVMDKLVR
jgi:vacuolar protein sorting-associated protein 13A/C